MAGWSERLAGAGEFEEVLRPFLVERCVKCHGVEKTKGKINLEEIASGEQLLADAGLIEDLMEVLDARDMPPEEEPQPGEAERQQVLDTLRTLLGEAASREARPVARIRRLNRFQYNNAVRDLFQLNRDVFALPEKLMTRETSYLGTGLEQMPERVEVECRSLREGGGLRGVQPFPKDLRAAHGFDNQANQLTLSPLLLDTFLKLSVSIVESPDFTAETVGIWDAFFVEPPEGAVVEAAIRDRLAPFLEQAFRSRIDEETLGRYTAYAAGKVRAGLAVPEAMKKVASAVLSSPRFLFRHGAAGDGEDLHALASDLAFFLWGSGPDRALLDLAGSGDLARADVFEQAVGRMLADPKIERFLDAFPSQWMQLENILAATPDPGRARLFSLDKQYPAGLQMVLEPLLLFDAVFVEDRPVTDLLAPAFSYRSEFLRDWYAGSLVSPEVDVAAIEAENRRREDRLRALESDLSIARNERDALVEPVRAQLLRARREDGRTPVELKPIAAWEFDGSLEDAVGSLHLEAHGAVRFEDGAVVLENSYLQSAPLGIELKAKTLEVWCQVHDVDQRGGGAMGIQGPGDFFDTIVLGERKPRHWISGSNGFSRTEDFPESTPEEQACQPLQLVMVYQQDGTTSLYRNGDPYGKSFRKGAATFPPNQSSVLFGLRHLPAAGGKYLSVSIERARLYDRALTREEVAASAGAAYVSDEELRAALGPERLRQREELSARIRQRQEELRQAPRPEDPRRRQQDAQNHFDNTVRNKLRGKTFERGEVSDPRYGGIITNAAMLSMTSGPDRTHPIARGAWIIEVVFNDPPPPPPNDVPPLNEDASAEHLTIREKFAQHRESPDCAGCHARLDPLGFALENYDLVGRWREVYENGRPVDASGTLLKRHPFTGSVDFKQVLVAEERRFARAFAAHLLRFALSRELGPREVLEVDAIVERASVDQFRLQTLIREVLRSESFRGSR